MMNLFKIDTDKGYQWWTFSHGEETRDNWGWVKLGPLSIAWGALRYEGYLHTFPHRHVEVSLLARWLFRCHCNKQMCGFFEKVQP